MTITQPLLQVQETATTICLQASHSTLEFNLWQAGFVLKARGSVVLKSASGWGEPCTTLNAWIDLGNQIILTYNRGSHGLGRLTVSPLEHGWRLAWDQPTHDTFDLASGGHWYGQGAILHQQFPLEKLSQWETSFITWNQSPTGLGNILEAAWLTSTGVAIMLDDSAATLQVGMNAPPSSVSVMPWEPSTAPESIVNRLPDAHSDSSGMLTFLDRHHPLIYQLLVGDHVVEAHQHLISFIGKPEAPPPENLLREPIWSTWARYKTAIDQRTILAFAKEIRDHGFPGSTLQIDDKWQLFYGDTFFDSKLFPDPIRMVAMLRDLGFATTLWMHPFLGPQSKNTLEAVRLGYIVRQADGTPYEVSWWQGKAYLLDVSNSQALDWWAEKLLSFQARIGVAGFKMDGGEAAYLPADALLANPLDRNAYTTKWVQFAAQHFPYAQVRSGWHNQTETLLFRQWNKYGVWGTDNGMASIITGTLALGLVGYPFVLPDTIGGNWFVGPEADRELFIRWTQANAALLTMQFSYAPWDYDEETAQICQRFAVLHQTLAPLRIAAAEQAVRTGQPPIRPIFWQDPSDPIAQVITDAFMLGDTLLVAPVVQRGAVSRDIYLPRGRWRDYWSDAHYEGGRWLMQFPAPLPVLPLFVRVGS